MTISRLAQKLVRKKLAKLHLTVGFAGRLINQHRPPTVGGQLRQRTFTWASVEDELILDPVVQAKKIPARILSAAISKVSDVEGRRHLARVMLPLMKEISDRDRVRADSLWTALATNAFETSPEIVVQSLRQYIWLVKRRTLRLPTSRQIMPLILGSVQGAGKSDFLRIFLKPLSDLVAYTSLSAAIDDRQGDLLSFPALVIDDVDPAANRQALARFKALVTGEETNRRPPGTSRSEPQRIVCTFIGSANEDPSSLFADASGYRRLVPLYFRNGQVDRGGDPRVWATINATDMRLLWRSVDVKDPAPIDQIWRQLAVHQRGTRLEDVVLAWIKDLDIDSEVVRVRISGGVIRVADLLDLFEAETKVEISPVLFGRILKRLTNLHEDLPIGAALHGRNGNGYSVRPKATAT